MGIIEDILKVAVTTSVLSFSPLVAQTNVSVKNNNIKKKNKVEGFNDIIPEVKSNNYIENFNLDEEDDDYIENLTINFKPKRSFKVKARIKSITRPKLVLSNLNLD